MCGKYDDISNHFAKHGIHDGKVMIANLVLKVANELAEANRLKIVELKLIAGADYTWGKPDGGSVMIKNIAYSDLEDKA